MASWHGSQLLLNTPCIEAYHYPLPEIVSDPWPHEHLFASSNKQKYATQIEALVFISLSISWGRMSMFVLPSPLLQHHVRLLEQVIPLAESRADQDRMGNRVGLRELVNIDHALLHRVGKGGGLELGVGDTGGVELLDQIGTTLHKVGDLGLAVLGNVASGYDAQLGVEDAALVATFQQLAATTFLVAEVAVDGGKVVVDGGLAVTHGLHVAAVVRTEESLAGVLNVRLAIVTREVVDVLAADAAVDLPTALRTARYCVLVQIAAHYHSPPVERRIWV